MTARRDNGLHAPSYTRLDDVAAHLVDGLLARLRDAGVAAYSAPTPGRRGPYGETVPPLGPSDAVYVDSAHRQRAAEVRTRYLREVQDDQAWADIVAGFDAPPADPVPPWPASEEVAPDAVPAADPAPPGAPAVGFGVLRDGLGSPVDEPSRSDEHYRPPPPPPLPQIDRVARFAWAGALGGPLVLVLAALAGLQPQGWVGVLAVGGFVAGFVTLVARMQDRGPGSGPDDGAVV